MKTREQIAKDIADRERKIAEMQAELAENERKQSDTKQRIGDLSRQIESKGGEEPEHLILAFDRTKKWVGADVSRNGTHAVEGAGRYKKQGNMLNTEFNSSDTLETKRLRIECMIKHLVAMGVTEAEANGKSEYVEIAKEFMKQYGIAVKGEPKESVLNVDKEPVARLA